MYSSDQVYCAIAVVLKPLILQKQYDVLLYIYRAHTRVILYVIIIQLSLQKNYGPLNALYNKMCTITCIKELTKELNLTVIFVY